MTRHTRQRANETPDVDMTTSEQPHSSAQPSPLALQDATTGQGASVQTTKDILDIISNEISNISEEGKVIVSSIVKAIQIISKNQDLKITQLQNQVDKLQTRVTQLESEIDDCNQYERRDTVIISGPSLPKEIPNENPSDVVIRAIKDNLHVNISHTDLNVAHRLGPKKDQNTVRPLIVKLHSRQKKTEIMDACITVRPNLYINESLTSKRRALFKSVWDIRKQNRELFQQCYTKDGKIIVKLKSSNRKHTITSDESLSNFLDSHPILKQNAET